MKKHYTGAVYDLTAENMNHLIEQLEEERKKNLGSVSFYIPNDYDHKWEIACHFKATRMQVAISNVLNDIRSRLKYSDDVSEQEKEFLTKIREELYDMYIEEE